MRKDYVKYIPAPEKPPRKKRHFLETWVILSVVIMVTLLVCLARLHRASPDFFSKPFHSPWVKEITSLFSSSPSVKPIAKPLSPVNQPPDIHFEFYRELSNDSVIKFDNTSSPLPLLEPRQRVSETRTQPMPLKPSHHAEKTSAAMSSTIQYRLQFGRFQQEVSANALRISLLLAGIDAALIKQTMGNQVFYVLQQGEYTNLNDAKMAQHHFQKKGIVSEILPITAL